MLQKITKQKLFTLTSLIPSISSAVCFRRALSDSQTPLSATATQPANALNKYQLVSACYGISKEQYSNSPSAFVTKLKKRAVYGDDAWFISSHKTCDTLAVADGVGGWRDSGVDPSVFSSTLMRQCKRVVEQEQYGPLLDPYKIDLSTPLTILASAYHSMIETKDSGLMGSSTACVLVFNRETRRVYAANLGDSGFLVVRDNKVIHRSQQQFHYFNCPLQLSLVPAALVKEGWLADKPEEAALSSVELVEGDFIVTATDGLWDNLDDSQILPKLTKFQVNYCLDKKKFLTFFCCNFDVN
jgi:protein phosphatase PTC7